MNIQNFNIFDKSGDQLQWTPDSYINLKFDSVTGKSATGFLITDPSALAVTAKITNGGYLYDDYPTLSYQYIFSDSEYVNILTSDASIIFKDVSIFNPNPTNTRSISGITLDLSTNFVYPSVTYAGAVFLKPISQGLVETEHLFFLEASNGQFIRPYDPVNSTLIFQMIGDEYEIKFFTVDENTQEVNWTDTLQYDMSEYAPNVPITINIGFNSSDGGVFERKIRIIHQVEGVPFTLGEILVNAESIDEDERFRTLATNFGFPDAANIPSLFKEADINESLPDWQLINSKSKLMMLEHDNIMPFIGTYKGLVNAIKWLGYDDIYIREWFLNVKENKKLSLIIPYEAKDRTQTILSFSSEQRKTIKKLNQISLNYCITRETGSVDEWGTPVTENCYTYNLQEVFIKLLSLKSWLEKNIIGVNCRIVDINGEGVYFERYKNLIYNTTNTGIVANYRESLTPVTIGTNSELLQGEASIGVTIAEISKTKIQDLKFRFKDFVQYLYDASGNVYSPENTTLLNDPSILKVGPPIKYPFANLVDIQWKASIVENNSGVLDNRFVTNPLFMLENEIRYYNIFDVSSHFYDVSTNLHILIEKAYIRDPSNDVWLDSSMYAIFPDPCDNSHYFLESSLGVITHFNGNVSFDPSTNSSLDYNISSIYSLPLLSFKNFKYTDISGNTGYLEQNKEYYLDIIDGKIEMNDGLNQYFINFNYDTSLKEQEITLNVSYDSGRLPLYVIDPSVYFNNGPTDPSVLTADNSIYVFSVNHIGNYNIELFGFDGYNVPFYNRTNNLYNVWIKTPTIYTLIDSSCVNDNTVCASTFMLLSDVSTLINNNKFPIYDRDIQLYGLTVETDDEGKPFIKVPSISFFVDIPENGSIQRFFNLTERCVSINSSLKQLTFDQDFQNFYTGDNIVLVKFDKGKYSLVQEVSTFASNVSGNIMTVDNLPIGFTNFDVSTDIYLINDTYRNTSNYINDYSSRISTIDISNYVFRKNQMVSLIVDDNVTGYSWGASYRVLDVSGYTHTINSNIPKLFIDSSTRYTIKAKHSFSAYSEFTTNVSTATENDNFFNIYLNDDSCSIYYLDSTFTTVNILFDHEVINDQWYNASDNLLKNNFYFYTNPINVDVSTLIILNSIFDSSTYLLNQKNIWTVKRNEDKSILFKVFNDNVPYIFNETGYYDVLVESYDSFGNLSLKNYEGLINII